MPVCNKCGVMKASSEMRRSPKSGHLCKDKVACSRRRKEKKKVQLAMAVDDA